MPGRARRIEVGNAVPQRKIGRRGFLRLQCQDTSNGVADVEPRTPQEQLSVWVALLTAVRVRRILRFHPSPGRCALDATEPVTTSVSGRVG